MRKHRLFSPPEDWFGPRTSGVGIEPKTWEGAVVVVLLIAATVTLTVIFARR